MVVSTEELTSVLQTERKRGKLCCSECQWAVVTDYLVCEWASLSFFAKEMVERHRAHGVDVPTEVLTLATMALRWVTLLGRV